MHAPSASRQPAPGSYGLSLYSHGLTTSRQQPEINLLLLVDLLLLLQLGKLHTCPACQNF